MSSDIIAILLSATLLLTVVSALLSKKVSTALILLFYASLVLGVIFTVFDDTLIGLVTMITFAGAISVLILTVVLMTGQSTLESPFSLSGLSFIGTGVVILAAASLSLFSRINSTSPRSGGDLSLQLLSFIWEFRPWDLLILIMVFSASMVSVINLLSREGR